MLLKPFVTAISEQNSKIVYGENPAELYDPIKYIMALGGKRLRPMLTLLTANLFTDNWQKSLEPALAVEVFHNFTLMHDDIMDNAPLRRGKPTVHEKWNANVAILSGDVMLVNAYELFLNVSPELLPKVLKRFNRTAAEVCEGQQLDMNFEKRDFVSEKEYLEMIRLKTSVLLGYAMELGAMLAGADQSVVDNLYNAGVCFGLGFQLTDDLLDVYGDPEKFGKQVGGDIISNKKTFLLIEALERSTGNDKVELLDWLSKKEFYALEKVNAITTLYSKLGINLVTEKLINSYFQKGFDILNQIDVSSVKKQPLIAFVEMLTTRQS